MTSTDNVSVELDSLVEEIDNVLKWVAENGMGEYVKIDQINDRLLDLRRIVSPVTSN